MKKTCRVCHMEFEVKGKQRLEAKYCSKKCYHYYLKQYSEHTKKKYWDFSWMELTLFGLIIAYGITIIYFTN